MGSTTLLRGWQTTFSLEREQGRPLYQQVTAHIIREVQRGRLKPGSVLPGTRALSKALQLNRNTVATAYDELVAQGWLTAESGRGTFVSKRLPRPMKLPGPVIVPSRVPRPALEKAYRQARGAELPLSFASEQGDSGLLANARIERSFRRAALQTEERNLTDARGALLLRRQLANLLSNRRGLTAEPEAVLVTPSRQRALYLCARHLAQGRGAMAFEQPGNRVVWETFRALGARIIGVPVDVHGLDVAALRKLSREQPIKAVYVTPHLQFPTAVRLSPLRRRELMRWAADTGATILEDDCGHDLEFDGLPALSLASMDQSDSVLHLGSFSPSVYPEARQAYLAGCPKRIRALAEDQSWMDEASASARDYCFATLLRTGCMQRRAEAAGQVYRQRRDHLLRCLAAACDELLDFTAPPAGTAVWVRPRQALHTTPLAAALGRSGLELQPASAYTIDGCDTGGLRLCFGSLDFGQIEAAVDLLAQALRPRTRVRRAS